MTKKKKISIITTVLVLGAVFTAACIFSNSGSISEAYDNPFLDVKDSDWFSADVQYANEQELMSGTSDTTFSPNDTTTRGMLVTVLWRLEGKPEANKNNSFADVESDQYYYDAISWASDNSIVSGYSETQFAPNDSMTREQLAAVLYRYANYKQYDTSDKADLSTYIDVQRISGYAVDALKWANANGIISGTSSNMLEPQGNAQRAQIASILHRFCVKYVDNNIDKQDNNKANNINEQDENKENNNNEQNVKDADIAEVYINETNEPTKQNEHQHSASGTSSEDSNSTIDSQNDVKQAENSVEIISNSEPTIIVNSVVAKPGESIQLIANIENNPGILGMTLTANYDESVLTLESVENGEAFNEILDLTTSKDLKSGSRFVWDGVDISDDNIKNGTMLIMNFKVADSTGEGNYLISLSYADGDIVDKNLSEVSMQMQNGYITVGN